jgi:DNA-binding XRE family transcriptional regulator
LNKVLDPKEIGRRLRELRGIKTRTGTAKQIGISYSALSKYEDGLKTPNDATKVKIADYYNVPVQSIFFDP